MTKQRRCGSAGLQRPLRNWRAAARNAVARMADEALRVLFPQLSLASRFFCSFAQRVGFSNRPIYLQIFIPSPAVETHKLQYIGGTYETAGRGH